VEAGEGSGVDVDDRPRARPVSHRATPPVGEAARRLVPALTAVTAVVVVIVLLLFLNSRPTHSDGGPGPAVVATGPASSPPSAASAPPSSPSGTAPGATHPSAAAPPVSQPPATQTAAATKLPVTVLNNSRRTGLAHEAAAQVARGGWPVAHVGNFTGRIAESTIYYAAGQRGAAVVFARQFPAVRRVLPRFAGLPGSGLTLVVTRDWPS
jgi:transposase-like protein